MAENADPNSEEFENSDEGAVLVEVPVEQELGEQETPEPAISAIGGSGLGDVDLYIKRGGSGQNKEFEEIDADPTKVRRLFFEHAHLLATMPRHKISDLLQGAFWALIASSAGAIGGWMDITKPIPANDKLVDIAGISVFSICGAFFLFSLIYKRNVKTSEEYLSELYKLPSKEPGKIRKFWRDWFG